MSRGGDRWYWCLQGNTSVIVVVLWLWKMIPSDILKFYIKIAGTVVRALVQWKTFLMMLTRDDQ